MGTDTYLGDVKMERDRTMVGVQRGILADGMSGGRNESRDVMMYRGRTLEAYSG